MAAPLLSHFSPRRDYRSAGDGYREPAMSGVGMLGFVSDIARESFDQLIQRTNVNLWTHQSVTSWGSAVDVGVQPPMSSTN